MPSGRDEISLHRLMVIGYNTEKNMTARVQSKALFSVLTAGTLWSFGALTIRYMVDPQIYRWQYLFFRGLTIATVLCIYLMAKDGGHFFDNFKKIGLSGLIGACGLVGAFAGFIWSITLTTVANALFMFATIPFLGAIMGIWILKEKIRSITWIAMTIALMGITVMVIEGLEAGSVSGTVTGLAAACGFAAFSVSLRWRKETPQFATIALAGILCAALTASILLLQSDSLLMPIRNVCLSMVHGTLVGVGLIFFSLGARYFPAAELNLFSLVEVVGGVIWVYLPIFGINEVPSMLTVIGGCIVSCAIIIDSVGARHQSEMVNPIAAKKTW
jgi:DME family drug/metabolite transporter